ncbi:MAG: hypothetical protein LBC02_06485 [Planctomycetaceae bacterium]|jgi:hypothetical protein|nr:hypothetical protein [Planctomycetaceae bacterium]
MTLILLFLFLLLDLQHLPIPNIPYQEFTVLDPTELAGLGCSMNPMDGYENVPSDLTVDWADTFKDQTNPSPPTTLQDLQRQQDSVVPMRMIDDNPVVPNPPSSPDPPQPIATPEPPPIAILTISGLALLYLLFGYSRRLRHYH